MIPYYLKRRMFGMRHARAGFTFGHYHVIRGRSWAHVQPHGQGCAGTWDGGGHQAKAIRTA